MKSLISYRPVISPEIKEIFMECLKTSIKNIDMSNFGFVGIINSEKEISHDIDILVFPSKKAKIGEAMLSLIKFYDKLESELKKKNEIFYISTAPKKIMQEMIYYLSSLEEGEAGLIPIHSLFFTNYKAFKRLNPLSFQKMIKKDLITIYGDFNVIKELPIFPEKILEIYYLIIEFEMANRIKNFPRHLIRASAESLFKYIKFKNSILTKYDIKIEDKKIHSIDEIEREFIRILRELDKNVYSSLG